MPCPGTRGERYSQFFDAMESFDLWEAFFCSYGTPMGDLVVGTMVYGMFMLGIFARTKSAIIPFVLLVVFGVTIVGRMLSVVTPIVGLLVLVVAPLVVGGAIFTVDRLG